MRTRFLVAAVCIFTLPLWAAPSLGNRPVEMAPYATVAYAGHTLGGSYSCNCETAGCIEDYPGECGGYNTNQQTPSDLGSGTLLILAALLLGLKLRA